MFAFTIVWAGQLVSSLGSRMTAFALMIWVWQRTGEATSLALIGFFAFVPAIIVLPFAGSFVDRWNRKLTMILSDLSAGIGTVVVLVLYMAGSLEIWHIYIVMLFAGAFGAFQFPAYSAAVTTMVEKKHFARASAMLSMVGSVSGIFGPPLAAVLLVFIGIEGVMSIDIATFCFAIAVLLFVRIPQPERAKDLGKGAVGVFKDALYGFKYIVKRRPLLGLQLTFLVFNLCFTLGMVLLAPMILARTNSDKIVFASVQMVMSVGGLAGGIILAVWGGPKKRINGLLGGMALIGLFFAFAFGVGRTVMVWMVLGFFGTMVAPVTNASSQAIWQAKVSANIQGRVFSARGFIAQGASAISMLVAGPLADRVFEPGMLEGGSLAPYFGWLVGTGPGAGMALIIFFSGMLAAITALISYSIRSIRDVETTIPDAVVELEADGEGEGASITE